MYVPKCWSTFVYLHFWYLNFVCVILPAEIVPRPRPRWIRVRVRIGCRRGHQTSALHLRLCMGLLQLQLQRLVMYHRTTLQNNRRSSRCSSGTQLRVIERRLRKQKTTPTLLPFLFKSDSTEKVCFSSCYHKYNSLFENKFDLKKWISLSCVTHEIRHS